MLKMEAAAMYAAIQSLNHSKKETRKHQYQLATTIKLSSGVNNTGSHLRLLLFWGPASGARKHIQLIESA